ncbi:NAD(P)-dependent alcohol dehydrogenase [Microscilla marina]|uniref:Oxidoreductase, zinc-binding, putative n=1 Tax=Microscilla marina ATCC 23134 TaxID=313606 RepID=A1ZE28_MICM2|nr:NAD(P)-dependent alcohol dehydrogenase [Microscilla marina]EAY31336.1 oxidoreductase, zinc-binding, putative [Microscilla marina ATCC 23134]
MKGLTLENKHLQLREDLPLPVPNANELLVKVMYATVNPTDADTVAGNHALLAKLLGAKRHLVNTGLEFSGIVQKSGKRFKQGDRIFGYVDLLKGIKTHQEYICIDEDFVALMPAQLSFEESAAMPLGALTSLIALQDLGQVSKGSKVLINGASGGLGVYAIQIARLLGANVTAVAGTNTKAFLSNLGANQVINYQQPLKSLQNKFDLILDLSTLVKYPQIKHLLNKSGKFIPANPFNNLPYFIGNAFRNKKVKYLMVENGDSEKLTLISSWAAQGKLRPVVDSVFSLANYAQAFRRIGEKGRRGRVVIQMSE